MGHDGESNNPGKKIWRKACGIGICQNKERKINIWGWGPFLVCSFTNKRDHRVRVKKKEISGNQSKNPSSQTQCSA